MIMYGDQHRHEDPLRLIRQLHQHCNSLLHCSLHDAQDRSTSLLISCGELAQGLLDAQFYAAGQDEWTPLAEHCAALMRLAASTAVDGCQDEVVKKLRSELECIQALDIPESITIKTPEGFAFYAVYPELYAFAAAGIEPRNRPEIVIGLRSIGISLAAVVAHRFGSTAMLVTLRPTGHPYDRTINLGPKLLARLLANASGRYGIVDEGPGLSGSSFMAVADWLIQRGVKPEQLDFFPSHAGEPGSKASDSHRSLWQNSHRHVFGFEAIACDVLKKTGAGFGQTTPSAPWRDLSGGKWRDILFAQGDLFPPCNLFLERRKYLSAAEEPGLAKFAGLGQYGQLLFARAKLLSSADLIPPVRDLRRGFILSDWLTDAVPLLKPRALTPFDRSALLEQVARYLEYLVIYFPANQPGANANSLCKMAEFNLSQVLSEDLRGLFSDYDEQRDVFDQMSRPIGTDNKMQPWEWLRQPDGKWLKADALEHHADHCCIGAQDVAWDVAGAICELEMTADESISLIERLSPHSKICRSPAAFEFYQICYIAFQIGYCTLSAQSHATFRPESERFAERTNTYRARLLEILRGLAIQVPHPSSKSRVFEAKRY
jgi:hypothetical protein